MNSVYLLLVRGLVALGTLLALVAAGLAKRSQGGKAGRSLLKAACVAGLMGLVVVDISTERGLFASPVVGIAAAGIGIGIWALILYPREERVRWLGGLAMATMLAIYFLGAHVAWAGLQVGGWLFGLAELFHALAVGAFLLGGLCLLALRPKVSPRFALPTLSVALLLETALLVLYALGAQLTWGSYWSWNPIECWHLAGWLVMAMAILGVRSLHWSRRQACWALGLGGAFEASVLIGSYPLVLYLMR